MIPDELFPYNGNLKWLKDRTILYVRSGSHAYGLATPESDQDFKGIAVPPIEYIMGFTKIFDETDVKGCKNIEGKVYSLHKFMKLCKDCNPNIIEVLYVEPEDQIHVSKAAEILIDARDKFLSKKALYTFSGYAMSQLKRIKTHRKWLLDPPTHMPTRAEFGLPEKPVISKNQLDAALSMISKQVDSWELNLQQFTPPQRQFIMDLFGKIMSTMSMGQNEKWKAAAGLMGFDTNFLMVLESENRYRSASNNWKGYMSWKEKRNPTRAAMEVKFGFDCKHALHLVRLFSMCEEILTSGKVLVRRPDAGMLLDIKHGKWTYEDLLEWAKKKDAEMRELAKTSSLPHSPDTAYLDTICMAVVEQMCSQFGTPR